MLEINVSGRWKEKILVPHRLSGCQKFINRSVKEMGDSYFCAERQSHFVKSEINRYYSCQDSTE